MSILRAKTQMLKQKDRLISKITETETAIDKLSVHKEALKAQIEGIDNALKHLDMGEAP